MRKVFAAFCLLLGAALAFWFVYNLFVEMQPELEGHSLALAIFFCCLLIGYGIHGLFVKDGAKQERTPPTPGMPTEPELRYAGFWPRLGALLIDILVFAPFIYLAYLVYSLSWKAVIIYAVPSSLLGAFYNIYFHGRWGQTVGKMLLKIRVTKLDGSPIYYDRAFYRHAVDFVLGILQTIAHIVALLAITEATFNAASGFWERMQLESEMAPAWQSWVYFLIQVWAWSELVVLLLNKKRRALHDFIAGTVVIHIMRKPGREEATG